MVHWILLLSKVVFLAASTLSYKNKLKEMESFLMQNTFSQEVTTVLNCFNHPEKPFFMGIKFQKVVSASLSQLEKTIEAADQYHMLFQDLVSTTKITLQPLAWTVIWVKSIPVPFFPDIVYEIKYEKKILSPNLRIYNYYLTKASRWLDDSFGFIFIKKFAPNRTLLIHYSFWDAHYGPLEILAPERIWWDNIKNAYHSNLALQMSAEFPELEPNRVKTLASNNLDETSLRRCITSKKPFSFYEQ